MAVICPHIIRQYSQRAEPYAIAIRWTCIHYASSVAGDDASCASPLDEGEHDIGLRNRFHRGWRTQQKQMTVGKSFFRFLVRRDAASAAFQSLIFSLISRGSILMSLFFASRAPEKNVHDNDIVSLGRSVLSSARSGRSRVFRRAKFVSYFAVMFHSKAKNLQAF